MSDMYPNPHDYTVKRDEEGVRITFDSDTAYTSTWFVNPITDALRDFFLGEMGLWRDPETGLLVLTGTWANLGDGGVASVYDGDAVRRGFPNAAITPSDHAVARWCASLAPQPREPKPGEVWRITFPYGETRNAVAVDWPEGIGFRHGDDQATLASDIPADHRRILVEADGAVVSDE